MLKVAYHENFYLKRNGEQLAGPVKFSLILVYKYTERKQEIWDLIPSLDYAVSTNCAAFNFIWIISEIPSLGGIYQKVIMYLIIGITF